MTAGFPSRAWARVAKLEIGDYLLCYLVDRKQWIGLLRVTGHPYSSADPPIWGIDLFPSRVSVEIIEELQEDNAVSATDLIQQIPRLKDAADRHPGAWAGFLRGSPRRWPTGDAKVVINALERARSSPSNSLFMTMKVSFDRAVLAIYSRSCLAIFAASVE
ncbi:MAG TPA: hypothetical protein VF221_20250 [Chloroflexota bacterium]